MDNNNRGGYNEHLGVNKLGKNIRKSPLHQPNFTNSSNNKPQPPQPHVYNISKNDFRNIVQQLTGSPSQNQPLPQHPQPRPPNNVPKPPSMRLQKIRPPPLTPPVNRPPLPPPTQFQNQQVPQQQSQPQPAFNGGGQFGQQAPAAVSGDSNWGNVVAESPISAYMRYLQNSMLSPRFPQPPQAQGQPQPQGPPQSQIQPQPGLLPTPPMPPPFPSPPPPFPSPRGTAPGLLPSPPPFPSPRGFGPALLPSPTSQFLLPSPTAYMNFLSPRSAYPPPGSPGFPPLTPTFFSQFSHPGVLGPGPQTPNSPGFLFPLSPSGYFPMNSPRWRDQ